MKMVELNKLAQLNSIGLSKNILRALQASRVDLPPVGAFPKSHIVTFKYYVGVILFLEEDYAKVYSSRDTHTITILMIGSKGRREPDGCFQVVPP